MRRQSVLVRVLFESGYLTELSHASRPRECDIMPISHTMRRRDVSSIVAITLPAISPTLGHASVVSYDDRYDRPCDAARSRKLY